MELNLTLDELQYLQILVLRNSADSTEPSSVSQETSMSLEDQLLVKLQDSLDESQEIRNSGSN